MPAFHPKPQNNQHVFLVFNGMNTSVNSSNDPCSPRFTSVTCRFFCVYKFHAPKKLCKEDHPSPRWNKRHFTVREFEPMFGPEASGADSKAESINFFPREPSRSRHTSTLGSGVQNYHLAKKKHWKIWAFGKEGKSSPRVSGTFKTQCFWKHLIFGQVGRVGFPLHKPYFYSLYEESSILGTWNVWWEKSPKLGVTQKISSCYYLSCCATFAFKLRGCIRSTGAEWSTEWGDWSLRGVAQVRAAGARLNSIPSIRAGELRCFFWSKIETYKWLKFFEDTFEGTEYTLSILLPILYTPLKIDMEHNHGGLEDQVICRFHVNLAGCRDYESSPIKWEQPGKLNGSGVSQIQISVRAGFIYR